MKGIIRFSLNNKFAIWLLTFIVTAAGLYAGLRMKQETMPNIEMPVLTVSTALPGASPEEVADKISKPLEQKIKNLDGVKTVTSTSMENVSQIVLQYSYSKDMDKAIAEAKEAVSGFDLPQGAQKVNVSSINMNAFPVVSLSISGTDSQSLEDVTKLIEQELRPNLEGISGVASVEISGQHLKEVHLTYDKEKMNRLGISEDTVQGIIQASAVKAPLGIFEIGDSKKTIVVDGAIDSLDNLKNLEIPAIPSGAAGGAAAGQKPGAISGGQAGAGQMGSGQQSGAATQIPASIPTVKLSDIAKVELVGKTESISRTNGKESIGINVVKAPDANTVQVVHDVKEAGKKFEKEHEGTKAVTMLDLGKPIEDSIRTMLEKAVFGALFAVIIILLFLRNFRTTLISIVSIPLSLLIAILVLKQMDISLNIMTLGAMTVAIGRVVDDSIVVIENIYRRMSLQNESLKGKELILSATREMFMPIMSSTLVTIAVFLPLAVVEGPIGQLFTPFAATMVFALLASLLVAITIVPMMGHAMFKNGIRKKVSKHEHDKPGKLAGFYQGVLRWSLNHKWITFGAAILILIGSLFLVPKIGVSFLPEQEDKYVMVTYSPAPGEKLADTEKKALDAEKQLLNREGVTSLQYSVGGKNPMNPGPSNSALFYIQYDHNFKDFTKEKDKLVEDLRKLGGEWKEMEGGGLGGNKLNLYVYGDNLDEIKPAIDKIQDKMKESNAFDKVENSLSKSYEQYTLTANQEKLSKLGLTAGQVAAKLSPVRDNPAITTVKVDGKKYDVFVNVDKKEYGSIKDIENETITSPLGKEVPLKEVVEVKEGQSPNTVNRRDGKMYLEVKADIVEKDVGRATVDLQKDIDDMKLPSNIKVDFGGVSEQINDTFSQLGMAILAAIAIVYLVLVIFFGGALAPFSILFSLPFTIIGALAGLYMTGETLSVSAMMGALMLIGIVVTNAIVLLDRVIHKEREGLSTRDALLEAAGTRLRPILMTALATIGALLPLALGYESAGIISKGLAVTVIGGLTSSTLLTLLIVPIVYEALMKLRRKPRINKEKGAVIHE